MKCYIHGGNVIRLLFLSAKLLKFEIQKCGQILCAHKPYFLMPGHIWNNSVITIANVHLYVYICVYACIYNIILMYMTMPQIAHIRRSRKKIGMLRWKGSPLVAHLSVALKFSPLWFNITIKNGF